MADTQIEVGKEVLSYCTTCKMDLAHIVAAMKGDKIAKAECKTCGKTHKFYEPRGITTPPKKKKKRVSKKEAEAISVEAEWTRLMEAQKGEAAQSYNMKTRFSAGDKIKHSKFGEGVVGKTIYPDKIEVYFKSDLKLLAHAAQKFEFNF